MISFRIDRHHQLRDRQVVEIWENGRFIASLYGLEEGSGVKLVSKYLPTTAFLTHPCPFVVLNPTEPASLEIRFQSEEPRP